MGYIQHYGPIEDLRQIEVPFWELDQIGVAVVLLVCKGLLTLDEGVNVTKLSAEHLIHEAQSWYAAETMI